MNRCPYCGWESRTDYPVEFWCGSVTNRHRSKTCLALEIGLLKERVNRLEEAGDAVMKSLSCGCPHGDSVFHCRTCTNSWDAWRRAKETNP